MDVTRSYVEMADVRAPFTAHDAAGDVVYVELAPEWRGFIAGALPGAHVVLANSSGDRFEGLVVNSRPEGPSLTVRLS